MQDFEKEILACVRPPNLPTRDQVKNLCQVAHTSPKALQTLQETFFSRLERPKELQVPTTELEHILVVLRQCCFIAPRPFVDFYKDRLYVIASFCNYEDRSDPHGAIKVAEAAEALSQLLRNDHKLNEERRKSNPSFSPPQRSFWLPSPSSYQDSPLRARDSPLLSPTQRRSFLPTPDASPVQQSSLSITPDDGPPRREQSERAVHYQSTGEDDIERTVRQLLTCSLSELQESRSTLKEISQATFNEERLQIIISLFLEYLLLEEDEVPSNHIIKVLSVMQYCLKNGSPKCISALKHYQDIIARLKDKYSSRSLANLVKNILELLEQADQDRGRGRRRELPAERQPNSSASLATRSPARRSSILSAESATSNHSLFSSQEQLKDLTPFVELEDTHPFARGGYAAIYSAKLTIGSYSEKVVKKVLEKVSTHSTSSSKATELKRLLREINAWTGLKHVNVGLLYGFTRENHDLIGFISPFYVKGNINQYLKKTKNISDADFLCFMRGIAAGIVYLHQEGVIHGDIKGPNIMVGDDSKPKLIDFGVSRIVGVNGFTTSGNGTSWAWAAPELLKEEGMAPKTQRSDIYSLASTFVEMMIGSPPLPGRLPAIALSEGKIPARPKPEKHRFYPGERLWCYMMHCWEKEENRPEGAEVAKFLDELGNITDGFD